MAVVRVDDFYRPLHDDVRASLDAEHGYLNYFDWERLRSSALEPLRADERARYQAYDWSTGRVGQWVEVAPATVVIVDGVYSLRPELQGLLDLRIFVDTPRNLRLERMLARGQYETDWIGRWMAAEDWYFERVRPAASADLIVNGSER